MKRYTIDEFRKQYPNDDACLHKLYQLRCANLVCRCGNDQTDKPFTKISGRMAYQCPVCRYQVYPMQGTIFQKSTTPLTYWFTVIFMQTISKNGVSAKEVERTLNICYKTALRMCHQIKILIAKGKKSDKILGIVQIDESFVGQKARNMHKKQRAELHANNIDHNANKTGIMGFVNEDSVLKFEVMRDMLTYKQRVRKNVDSSAIIVTDSHSGYKGLDIEFLKHQIINHVCDEYVKDGFTTNRIESAWSQIKRTLRTHVHVSPLHLQKYVDEVAFKIMHKDRQDIMFDTILSYVA